ncbi:MAG: phenylacetic acid degradation protein PaaD [Pseudomonadota bacterium]|jgi:acyl-CoA thioesterase
MQNNTQSLTPEELAAAVTTAMFRRDALAQHLGIVIEETRPGYARAHMKVRDFMLNGHGSCHGGMLFAFADTVFAYACNSYNENTVASGCTIDFLAPCPAGETLTAIAIERSKAGRTGIYDVDICDHRGNNVAVFRGRSYRIKGQVLAHPDSPEADLAQ